MGMDVLRVGVCCNDDFVVLPLLRQLQSNGMCFLWCDVFLRVEGLHEMKIHFAVTLAVLKFGADELRVANLRLAVDTCNQLPAFELGLLLLHDIVQRCRQSGTALSFRTVDWRDRCHDSRLPLQNFFQQFLDLQIEFIGFTDVDGTDPAHVCQCDELIEIRSLPSQRTGAVIEAIDVYDLFHDGACRQVLCQIHPCGLCVPADELCVTFRDTEGQ